VDRPSRRTNMALFFASLTLELFIIFLTLLIYLLFRLKEHYKYFEKRGMKSLNPVFLIGNNYRAIFMLESQADSCMRIYKQSKHMKVCGFYQTLLPTVAVNDPAIAYRILTKDFTHFQDHGFEADFNVNPLERNLFNMKGHEWRIMRYKLSPTFSSGKLKGMFEQVDVCGQRLIQRVSEEAAQDIHIKDLISEYTTDVIGSTAFGINIGKSEEERKMFNYMGKKIFEPSVITVLKLFLIQGMPKLSSILKVKTIEKNTEEFFISLVHQAFQYRTESGYSRNDFLQLLLELKRKGHIDIADDQMEPENNVLTQEDAHEKLEMTELLLSAQAFVFFLAGFETTANTMSFTLYFLAANPEVQKKLREEIEQSKKKYGAFTYESLKSMTYLENCILEALRLFPPLTEVFRTCTKDYVFEDGSRIDKGTFLIIPAYALQRDPDYYSDPETFKPERFSEENIVPGTYLPFGDGPRHCIGQRFAMVVAKLGIATIIENFNLEPSPKMKEPIKLNPASFITSPLGGIWLRLNKIKS